MAVVVSAMGDHTDRLADLALEVSAQPDLRELDSLLSTGEQVSVALLAMALLYVYLLGARAPVILTSRADSVRARLASCAVAVLMVADRLTRSPMGAS